MDNTDQSIQLQETSKSQPEHKRYKFKQGQQQLNQQKLQQLNHEQLVLDDGDYYLDGWSQTFNKLQTLQTQGLYLDENQFSQIIWTLMTPRFTRLKHLDLELNNINNIEALQFLNCDTIQILILNYNHICSLKPLEKTKWNNLKSLSFYPNPISSLKFERVKISQTLQKINLKSKIQTLFQQNLSILAKIQASHFDNFKIIKYYSTKKGQPNVLKVLKQRYIKSQNDILR